MVDGIGIVEYRRELRSATRVVGGRRRGYSTRLRFARSAVVDRDSRCPVRPLCHRICRTDGGVVAHRARKHQRLRPLSPCWSPEPLLRPLAAWLAFRRRSDVAGRLAGCTAGLRGHNGWPVSFPLGLHNIGLRCGGLFPREMDSTGGACRAHAASAVATGLAAFGTVYAYGPAREGSARSRLASPADACRTCACSAG